VFLRTYELYIIIKMNKLNMEIAS